MSVCNVTFSHQTAASCGSNVDRSCVTATAVAHAIYIVRAKCSNIIRDFQVVAGIEKQMLLL